MNHFEDDDELDTEALSLDDIGRWSVRKNDMVEYYASIYASITANAGFPLTRYYIDGFANRGLSRVRESNEIVKGSALRLLDIGHPFDGYILVEKDPERASDLRANVAGRRNVEIVTGNANEELPEHVFPRIAWSRYERALVFLDPYNMKGLQWRTIEAAGKNRAIDAIIHFPTMDANRTVLMLDHAKIRPAMAAKMTAYWGNESWREGAYSSEGMLPLEGVVRKRRSEDLIRAFQERLRSGAGFDYVSEGIPARNSVGKIVYHLLFASHNKAAQKVMRSVQKAFSD